MTGAELYFGFQGKGWAAEVLGWVDGRGQATKPPLSLHRVGADPGPGLIHGWVRQGGLSCTVEAHGCCSPLGAQNYCSLGPPPASEKGCLCCASWSNRPLHKSKMMGGVLTVWCPVLRRKSTTAASGREEEKGTGESLDSLVHPPVILQKLRSREGAWLAWGSPNKG